MLYGYVGGSYSTLSASFGEDFYTYIYEAVTRIVENTYRVGKGLEFGLKMLGFLTSAFGFLVALHYGKLVFCSNKEVPHTTASSADDLDG